jgi:hypothetical protein
LSLLQFYDVQERRNFTSITASNLPDRKGIKENIFTTKHVISSETLLTIVQEKMGLFPDIQMPSLDTDMGIDPKKVSIDYDESPPYGRLSNMQTEKLVKLYNERAEDGSPVAMQKAQLILSELQRRDSADRERRMAEANDQVRILTWAIFALTLVNVMVAVYKAAA